MRVLLVSTYPPRICGIATFAQDLRAAMLAAPGVDAVDVVALDTALEPAQHLPEVVATVPSADPSAYRRAAAVCGEGGYDVVCIQHEFGIFGGPAGRHVLELADRVQAPVVTTAHTVLGDPPAEARAVLRSLAGASARLVALTPAAQPLLAGVYGIDERRIAMIPHGVHDVPLGDPDAHKAALGLDGRRVLLTFGLLSRNKGVELVLEAMPKVIASCPDLLYVVLGATHPEVRRLEGEEYRRALEARVVKLGLSGHVEFRDRYVDLEEVKAHLQACDVYVTPYRTREQITSGTLAYAVGMGCAVVSTPYRHAEELLADGRGLLVPFHDSEALAVALERVVADDELREGIRGRAYAYGRAMTWGNVGAETARLLAAVVAESRDTADRKRHDRHAAALGAVGAADAAVRLINLDHLRSLTDDTGIFQHATHGIADRRFGYTTDDQSRALIAVVGHHARFGDDASRALAATYLSFLQHAQRPDGRFRNVMDHRRRWLDDGGTEDTHGQTVWALAVASQDAPSPGMRHLAADLLATAMPAAAQLGHVRAMAYALCGLTRLPADPAAASAAAGLADRLVEAFAREARPGWQWCDVALTYASAKIPEALLRAGTALHRPDLTILGLDALAFVVEATHTGEQFDFVGNEAWRTRDGAASVFAQQPIEAGYTAQACQYAHRVTGDARYQRLAVEAAAWLLGRNRLDVPLYDPDTGVCADGLERGGASSNAGAESVICALLGLLDIAAPRAGSGAGQAS